MRPIPTTYARYFSSVVLVMLVLNPWTQPGVLATSRWRLSDEPLGTAPWPPVGAASLIRFERRSTRGRP
jgi:hypothetical protein